MQYLNLQILHHHIEAADRPKRNIDRSPVLLATVDALKKANNYGWTKIEVYRTAIMLRFCRYDHYYHFPNWLVWWLEDWDRGERVVPIEMRLGPSETVDTSPRPPWRR